MFHDLERNFLVLLAYLYHWYVHKVFKLLEIAAIVSRWKKPFDNAI